MVTSNDANFTAEVRVVQRRWVRREPPIWPFLWRGLLPLLGLLLLGVYALRPFAREQIQSTVIRETDAALAAPENSWVQVFVSGQDVTLSGVQPAANAGERALGLARAATCPSWAGRVTCAVNVLSHFEGPAAALVAPSGQAVEACESSLRSITAQTQIEFTSGSAAISPRSAPLLEALAKAARSCEGMIRVEGHTDAVGNAESNRALSEARASAVVAELVNRGFPRARLAAQGYGAEQPIADNATPAGRARNRRIEFHVVTDHTLFELRKTT